jgi:hypothetical protein
MWSVDEWLLAKPSFDLFEGTPSSIAAVWCESNMWCDWRVGTFTMSAHAFILMSVFSGREISELRKAIGEL